MNTATVNTPMPDAARPPDRPEKLRLGDVLVQQRLISQEQLQQTLELQRTTGKKVGRLLIETGVITEELLANGLARQLRIPFVNLKTFPFRADVVKLLAGVGRAADSRLGAGGQGRHSAGRAVVDPLDLFAYDELTRILKRNIGIAAVPESQLPLAFDRLYRRTEEISGLARALEKDLGDAVDFGELTATVGHRGRAGGAPAAVRVRGRDAGRRLRRAHRAAGRQPADPGARRRRAADADRRPTSASAARWRSASS